MPENEVAWAIFHRLTTLLWGMLHVKKCLKIVPLFSTCHGEAKPPLKTKRLPDRIRLLINTQNVKLWRHKMDLIISLISKVWEWFTKGVKHRKPFLATIRKNRDMGLCTPRTIIFLNETITLIFYYFVAKHEPIFR